ncbi:right-handed parallel beta-helix repeat-containing protein [uncultured Jatrophihabitans sp.]|uniref:right-handed parallel beta-helix repeat-containing protein n=1 Tax=uncultured Jatrophihabitans sp. TaxID=1610747 RepID=UPI0035CB588B
MATARAGTVIRLADGRYQNRKGDRWQLAASGTANHPITLEGGRGAILQSDSTKGDYGLWLTANYWHVTGITVRNATKGIVLDGSQHSIIDNVEVYDTGEEGVHFRSCSSDGVLQNSSIHDTGLQRPQCGAGVYVGSAQSNWKKYGCTDGQDKSERTAIRSNLFRHIAAEGADLKEGTDPGLLADNTFTDTG